MNCPKCQTEISDDSRFCSKCGIPIHPSDQAFISQTRTILKPMERLLPGKIFAGKYKVEQILGKGGMGIVYKAEDTMLKRDVALKLLPPELVEDKEAKERFVLEAQAAAALSHPNICTIHEINEEDGESFIAMEYVKGQSLREKLRKASLGVDEALDIAIQVVKGLEKAHSKDIIHRDIKSANIMVTNEGQAKVMDFGLAKVKGGTQLTREGSTLGTVAYMSPEQARGEEVDHRTDIWSVGVVLYEMLSGELPFKGGREASILYSVVHEEPKPIKEIKQDLPTEMTQIISRALKKNPGSRYASAAEMLEDLQAYKDILRAEELGALNLRTLLRRIRRPQVAIPAICAVLLIAVAAVWHFDRQAKIRWAREEALPELEQLVSDNWRDFIEPYKLAEKAEKYLGDDTRLSELFSECSRNLNILTEPPGADIYIKAYKTPDKEWEYLGASPLQNVRLPVGILRWKIEKEGYETVLAASSTWGAENMPYGLKRVLDKKGSIPDGMVRVPGAETDVGKLDDFYIDKYEVTNTQYKEFVESGGYNNKEYWKHEFVKDGEVLTWEEAMAEFVDQTSRPGPSTWQAGDFLEGQDDHPVSGISWYEAAAYAEFLGKTLPTAYHWDIARGKYTPMIQTPQLGGFAIFAPFSNFNSDGLIPVGSLPGITSYGAYDMAGNVREWCWNQTQKGRLLSGSAWSDHPKLFGTWSQSPAFDRSSKNGFRCALYSDPENIPESALQLAEFGIEIDFSKEIPVPDSIFQVYKEQFAYDKTALNAEVEWKNESHDEWIHERITLDAAYGRERIIAHLILPKKTSPPYQTVIYFPGAEPLTAESCDEMSNLFEFQVFLSFLVKNSRAVCFPVYQGTFERRVDELTPIVMGANTHQYTEYLIQAVKDFRRCVDYLQTRQDIDSNKLAFYGMCWGAQMGTIISAVEERLAANIFLSGGLRDIGRPEAAQMNYITRVKIPTLMLNGEYDTIFPSDTSITPMFNHLGTPEEHKELKMFKTDHIPPRNEFIKETLIWLDRYLGPIQ